MRREEIEKAVRRLLEKDSHGIRLPEGFLSTDSLFLKGIVDSFGIFPFVRALESCFKIKIKKSDIHPGTLETIEHVVDLIENRKAKKEAI